MPRFSNYGVIFIYMNIYDEAMGVFIPFGTLNRDQLRNTEIPCKETRTLRCPFVSVHAELTRPWLSPDTQAIDPMWF